MCFQAKGRVLGAARTRPRVFSLPPEVRLHGTPSFRKRALTFASALLAATLGGQLARTDATMHSAISWHRRRLAPELRCAHLYQPK